MIGIIGILIGLLLPAIRGARRQAYLVQCSSNLRTIASACLMNAQEKHGFLPLGGEVVAQSPAGFSDLPTAVGDPFRRRYTYASSPGSMATVSIVPLPAALAPYLGVRNLPFDNWNDLDKALNAKDGVWRRFMCPDTDALDKVVTAISNQLVPADQGTMMGLLVGEQEVSAWSTNTDYGLNEGVFGYHYDPRYSHNRLGGNMSKIRHASDVVLFTDAVRRKSQAYGYMQDGWICWTPSLAGTGPATFADAWVGNGRVESKDSFDLKRHSGRMNVAFLDGHVQTVPLKKESLGDVYLIAP